MADELKDAAQQLVKALDATNAALRKYFDLAVGVGRDSGDPTERGFNPKQVRQRLKAEVIARLSPRPIALPVGEDGIQRFLAPVIELDGAPEARRFVAGRPMLGFK